MSRVSRLAPAPPVDAYERAAEPWLERHHHDYRFIDGRYAKRHELVRRYAWAIPNRKAIDTICRYSPRGVVEIGAGGGLWARLIAEAGTDVVAYDSGAWRQDGDPLYFRVRRGWATWSRKHPERTLLLVWPPYDTRMARTALKNYAGDAVVYVGEAYGGCNGCDRFHEALERDFSGVCRVQIPRWLYIHDDLSVWRRRQA